MKRDMDLIRSILLKIENVAYDGSWFQVEVLGRSPGDVSYHVMLLHEAGLVDAKDLTTKDGIDWQPVRLTWEGHEFLDAARDDSIWRKAKLHLGVQFASVPIEVLKAVLVGYVRSAVLGHPG